MLWSKHLTPSQAADLERQLTEAMQFAGVVRRWLTGILLLLFATAGLALVVAVSAFLRTL